MVAMVPWTKATEVIHLIQPYLDRDECLKVEEIALDMGWNVAAIAKALFPSAKRVLDRFHVMKNVLDDIQAIRMRVKTKVKSEELTRQEKAKRQGKKYQAHRYTNNETKLQLITRLRYQVFER